MTTGPFLCAATYIANVCTTQHRVLGAHLDEFCTGLINGGYHVPSIRYKLWVLSDLARSMTNEQLAVADLDEQRVDEFVEVRRQRGRTSRRPPLSNRIGVLVAGASVLLRTVPSGA